MKSMGALVCNWLTLNIFSIITKKVGFYIFVYSFEILAGGCNIGEFECENKRCIHHNQTCDSNNDCGDWSDETDCRGS